MLPFGILIRTASVCGRFIALTILLLAGQGVAFSQGWWESLSNTDANFYTIQKSARAYFDTVGVGKGTGWKAYSRWEYYWQDRVDLQGRFPDPMHKVQEIDRFKTRNRDRRSTTSTGNWTNLGPIDLPFNGTGQPNGLGRVNCVAFHPIDPDILFAGAPCGGIWKSTDGGSSWSDLNNVDFRFGVSSIVIHPLNPDTIYVGTGDRDAGDAPGYGVYWSTDGGASWTPRNNGMGNVTVNEILMDPSYPDTLIAATNIHVFRSTDGGANWTIGLSGQNCKDIAFHPYNSGIVYAGGTRFYRSTDNGSSFTQVTSGLPTPTQRIALATSPADSHYVYVLAGDGGGFVGLYRSTNSGQSFTTRSTIPNILGYDVNGGTGSQAWYDLVLVADPNTSGTLYAGSINIWKSINGGQNWTIKAHWYGASGTPEVHADQHALEFSPHTDYLYNGNDGGVYYTANGGDSWPDISNGLDIAQVYKLGQSATTKDLVINGYQDNGTAFYNTGMWYTEIGGDGMECIVDPVNPDIMYGSLYYGDIRRSTNGGSSFSSIVGGVSESGGWVTPYKLHPNYPDTMFGGFENIWRTYNCKSGAPANNVSWTAITSYSGSANVVDLAISPANDNLMFYSRGATFYRSTNVLAPSPAWTDLTGNLPEAGVVRDIELHPRDENQLWISINRMIYYSDDQGASWTNLTGSLPDISLNTLVFDTSSLNEGIYIGMDEGVYYRDTTMTDWVTFSTGLASVEITELEIYYDAAANGTQSKIRASTYGRGLWESDLFDPGNLPPTAYFTVQSADVVCAGEVVRMEDQSSFAPSTWTWSISPGTYSFENGTSASSQNPEILFTASDTYTITLQTENDYGSDDFTRQVDVTLTPLISLLPRYEDFESESLCSDASDCEATICNLSAGVWVNVEADDIDWRIDEGGTPSTGTGPSIDYDPGSSSGNYAYLEASGGCTQRTAILQSNCIDLTSYSDATLTFAYHMEGINMGSLYVDVFFNGVWTDGVAEVVGDQGPEWNLLDVDLNPYLGRIINLRIRGVTGNNYESDIAIDGINIQVSGVILPIEDLVFNGTSLDNRRNQLRWTGLENSVDRYAVVERSEGGQFLPISGAIEVISQKDEYTFIDTDPIPQSFNYYRLRVTSQGGSIYYSRVVSLKSLVDHASLTIIPNPFSESIQVSIRDASSNTAHLSIIDELGRTRKLQTVEINQGIGQYQWDLFELAPGFYIIRWGSEQRKIIKVR